MDVIMNMVLFYGILLGIGTVLVARTFWVVFFGKYRVRRLYSELCKYNVNFIRESLGFTIEEKES